MFNLGRDPPRANGSPRLIPGFDSLLDVKGLGSEFELAAYCLTSLSACKLLILSSSALAPGGWA